MARDNEEDGVEWSWGDRQTGREKDGVEWSWGDRQTGREEDDNEKVLS